MLRLTLPCLTTLLLLLGAPTESRAQFRSPKPDQTQVPTNASLLIAGDGPALISDFSLRDPQGKEIALEKTEQLIGRTGSINFRRSLTRLRPLSTLSPNTKYTVSLRFSTSTTGETYAFTTGAGQSAIVLTPLAPTMHIFRPEVFPAPRCPSREELMAVRSPIIAGATLYVLETAAEVGQPFVAEGIATYEESSPSVIIGKPATGFPALFRFRPIAITGESPLDAALPTSPRANAVPPPPLRPCTPEPEDDYEEGIGACSAGARGPGASAALLAGLGLLARRRRRAGRRDR